MVRTTSDVREVTGGVDTHADTHTVAALDELGRLLGHQTFPATIDGYAPRFRRFMLAPKGDRLPGALKLSASVRGHEKVPTGGQVAVPSGGQ